MIDLANPKPGEKMADLGSGDGRILVAFAKLGIESHGFELDLLLVEKSEKLAKEENLEKIIHIWKKDFWEEDLSQFDIITMYPMPDIMQVLEEKIIKEMHPGSRVLLNYYPFPHLKYRTVQNNIYLYIKT